MSLDEAYGSMATGRHSFGCRFFDQNVFPNEADFLSLSQKYNMIPVFTQFLADTETPISIFRKIVTGDTGALLESVEDGRSIGRYSFIATDPLMQFTAQDDHGEIRFSHGEISTFHGKPLSALQKLFAQISFLPLEGMPPFYGGAIGYLGYEGTTQREKPRVEKEDPTVPDCQMFFPGTIIVYDHLSNQITVVVNCHLHDQKREKAYQAAIEKLQQVMEQLHGPLPPAGKFKLQEEPQGNISDGEFIHQVEKIIQSIEEGIAEQIVISRRYEADYTGDDFQVYRQLRSINPSPYMFYLRQGDLRLIGSSPEMLVKVEDHRVITCPIAGTRKRGKDIKEDEALVADLLQDPKELAEHQMLVQFAMEDLARVCIEDSIQVNRHLEPQYFSHVIHLASQVEGELAPNVSNMDALAACFPAGTVCGSPRQAAMAAIREIEVSPRGVYAGAVGYLGFNGNMDTAITIRTLVAKDNKIYFQAGAGIVADSIPEREMEEVAEKARAMYQALGL